MNLRFLAPLFFCPVMVSAQDLAITHVTVYASPDAPAQHDVTVLIRKEVIESVGANVVPPQVTVLPCQGCFVVAGFWNAHVHFMEPKWTDAAHLPAATLASQMADMVTHSGFTTVVDTGSDGDNTVALRHRVESGEVPGPRIFTAGFPLFPAHNLPYYLAPLPAGVRAKMEQPATPAEAADDVSRNRAAGFDLVKLFTGSIVQPNHIVPMQEPIAKAAVDRAHQLGLLVFAHTTNLAGTTVAIDAGVDVLAHAPEVTDGIDDAMMHRMIAQSMTMIPTLKLFSQDNNIADIRALVLRYRKLGGRLLYGTDTGFLPDYDQREEFHQLLLAGLSFRDVLAMLTTAPAALFNIAAHEGKVLPGMRGDLTILGEDPASGGPEAFTSVRYTIRGGVVIWQSR